MGKLDTAEHTSIASFTITKLEVYTLGWPYILVTGEVFNGDEYQKGNTTTITWNRQISMPYIGQRVTGAFVLQERL